MEMIKWVLLPTTQRSIVSNKKLWRLILQLIKSTEKPSFQLKLRNSILGQEYTITTSKDRRISIQLASTAFSSQRFQIVKTLKSRMTSLGQELTKQQPQLKKLCRIISTRLQMANSLGKTRKVSSQKPKEETSGETKAKHHTQSRLTKRIQAQEPTSMKKRKMTLRTRSSRTKQCMQHSTAARSDQ
jgi:hypothetical protein